MPAAPLPSTESERLKALRSYQILDTLPEQEYDDIVAIASHLCGTPIALVSIVDEKRQWFKARVGVDVEETDRDAAFCAHAILNQDEVLNVYDATQDKRFSDNPLVTGDPNIRFYAGSPLVTPDGFAMGTLCVIDSKPRKLTTVQHESLRALGRQVTSLLELRRRTNHLEFYREELERSNRELQDFAYVASHDLKEPLRGIGNLTDFLIADHGDDLNDAAKEQIQRMGRLANRMQTLINRLLDYARVGTVADEHESIDLAEIVQQVQESLASQIEAENVSIRLAGNPKVTGEKLYVEKIFQNLISNAIKYNDSATKTIEVGHKTIPIATNELVTAFYVADNGIGIPAKFRADVFTIFRRLHSQDEYGGGSGAGLTIVKKIIEKHRGKIWIDTSYQNGTCFWFTLEPIDESQQSLLRM